jgi:predicted transcriptional regulator
MFREEVLENETRRRIYRFVNRNPGLHLRELQRQLNIPLSSLDYHLDYLVRKGLRQRRLKEIILIILSEDKASYSELMSTLNIPASTLSVYLRKLVVNDILERHTIGRETYYTVRNEDKIANLLIVYKSSFMDRLIDNALITFLETNFQPKEAKSE